MASQHKHSSVIISPACPSQHKMGTAPRACRAKSADTQCEKYVHTLAPAQLSGGSLGPLPCQHAVPCDRWYTWTAQTLPCVSGVPLHAACRSLLCCATAAQWRFALWQLFASGTCLLEFAALQTDPPGLACHDRQYHSTALTSQGSTQHVQSGSSTQ